jgi:hypothetical protein
VLSRHIFPPFHLGSDSCLPLLAHLPFVPFLDGRVFKSLAFGYRESMRVEELLPGLIPAVFHALYFNRFEGVHGYTSDERDVDAEAAMDAGAIETDECAEFWGSL